MRGISAFLRFRFGGVFLSLALTAASHAAPRTPWTTSRVTGSPNPPAPFAVERVFPGISFNNPVDIAPLPGSDRWVVAEQGGKLWSFRATAGVIERELALDWPKHRPSSNILGFTFHPAFAKNRFIFINHNEGFGKPDAARISRFTVTSLDPLRIDPASERVIITWLSGGHNGCTLAFGPDGFLYFSTGDAANPDPPDMPYSTGQDISDLMSSVLRIDVNRTEGTNNYAVPKDNPFLKTPGARPEVWAFGLRNPFRMSFDRATGDLLLGDVGWEQWEMVHRIVRGGNYGWPITEGPNTRVRTDVKPGPGAILPALVAIPHSEGASVTGGVVYHGKKFPKLKGAYIYGDWETGKFWAARHKNGQLISNDELCKTTLKPTCFVADRDGELLVLDYNGGLYRFTPNTAPPANLAFPRKLSETGVFTSLAPLTPAPGVEPYGPIAPMWNDGAVAKHHLAIPGDGFIATTNARQIISGKMWHFPKDTVFARSLTLDLKKGDATSARRIETQLLHFDGQTWNPYSYRWNAAQTDAELVASEGASDLFNVTDASAPGGRREIPWRFHSRAECLRCHNAWSGETVGFNWLQLNATAPDGEFRRLEKLGLMHSTNAPTTQARLVNPHDGTKPLEDRARSWLHANCAACHRNGAGGAVPAHLNVDKKLTELRVLDAKPTRGDFGLTDARVIAAGRPYSSALLWRIATEGAGHMPAIGSRTVDEVGVRTMMAWIMFLDFKGSPESSFEVGGSGVATDARQALATAVILSKAKPEFRAEVLGKVSGSPNPLIRDLYQRFLPPEQRRRTLALDFAPNEVLSLRGDATRGRAVFLAESGGQCVRCHRWQREGRDYGPDLTDIARKYDRATLLTHVRQPNLLVAPEHRTHSVLLRDDTELTGFLKKRTATELLLRLEDGSERRVPMTQVASTRESALSAMPDGLLAALTAQEVADLLEFLVAGRR
ncbi:MAG: PQQ-dependent sugar dehydrogenase [Limisphaerales bacterium]